MNYSADQFLSFNKRKLGRLLMNKKERKIAVCPQCEKESDKIVKGLCNRCYNKNRKREKSQKRNQ